LTYNRFQQSVGPMDLVRNRNSKWWKENVWKCNLKILR
jgi:hypothetical protein